ncbi:MAG: energy-coupling factor transporter ATPase [Oscillospiraceae bacterium]|nr:energy-coupling factor transporter ATPase [Oscillospiraceae bacterium]
MDQYAIRAEKLNYRYDDTLDESAFSLKDISFKVERGTCLGIIGRTGSGKSTLIRLFNGLQKASSGKLYIDGIDLTDKHADLKAIRSKVGIVFQQPEYQLFAETVREDIAFGPRNMGLSEDEITRRVEKVAGVLGIEEILYKSPFELSGGEQKKVSIAGIISMEPDILVLDEPTAGLDPMSRRFIIEWLKKYLADDVKTVVIISHAMEDVVEIAENVMVLKNGAVDFFGDPRDLFTDEEIFIRNGLLRPEHIEIMQSVKEHGHEVEVFTRTIADAADILERTLNRQ